jgi:phospholipase C
LRAIIGAAEGIHLSAGALGERLDQGGTSMKRKRRMKWSAALAMGAMLSSQLAAPLAFADKDEGGDGETQTPIKHVIVMIGENHSFDNIYATYQPKSGQNVLNLLAEGIVKPDGSPGPNAGLAKQFAVNTPLPSTYFISSSDKKAYSPFLPTPELNGAPNAAVGLADINSNPTGVQPPFDKTVSDSLLATLEPSLESSALGLLRTGATGASGTTGLDSRVTNASKLQNTVFQWTGATLPYDAYQGDQVHRLFHMWQQSDCDVTNATAANPSGCLNDLYPFVGIARDDSGGNSMGFFNMQAGDAPVLKRLADEYTMSDNFHESVMGGTAANHIELGDADAIFWETFKGITSPPANIANPDPTSPTSDKYKKDKQWTNCSDTSQPGIPAIVNYLKSLPYHPSPNCAAGKFYMINNLSPGFLANGQIYETGILSGSNVPPSSLRTIGDELNDHEVSWAYYGGGYNAAVRVANGSTDPLDQLIGVNNYCDICNFESYATSIMGDSKQRAKHIKDAVDFFSDVEKDELPAVSFLKPDGFLDGHPASSKLDLFEAMLEKVLDELKKQPDLFESTALIVTFDENGGSWDSGYFQPIDFFGDATRIPLIMVSKYSKGGKVVHSYTDHVSILKFIERNWGLNPLTSRSRDNLHNPIASASNPYVPTNAPAIGDLMDMFDFDHHGED